MCSKGLGGWKTINITSLPSGGFSQVKAHILPEAVISNCKTTFFSPVEQEIKTRFL